MQKKCSKCLKEKHLSEYGKNKRSADRLEYRCKRCILDDQKQRYRDNYASRLKTLERNKVWKQKNPEKHKNIVIAVEKKRKTKECRKEQLKNNQRKRRLNPIRRMRNNVSRQVIHGLKRQVGSKQGQPIFEALGYNPEQLKDHLEKQFDDKMNWDNYGSYWHIDHIRPHSLYEYSSLQDPQFQACWDLNNLRPLEKIENMKKGNKIIKS